MLEISLKSKFNALVLVTLTEELLLYTLILSVVFTNIPLLKAVFSFLFSTFNEKG